MPKRSKAKPVKEKNPAAVALGRLGGLKGGPARMAQLSAKQKSELGRKAVLARWKKNDPIDLDVGPRTQPRERKNQTCAPQRDFNWLSKRAPSFHL